LLSSFVNALRELASQPTCRQTHGIRPSFFKPSWQRFDRNRAARGDEGDITFGVVAGFKDSTLSQPPHQKEPVQKNAAKGGRISTVNSIATAPH
jgi:hypothetical protein